MMQKYPIERIVSCFIFFMFIGASFTWASDIPIPAKADATGFFKVQNLNGRWWLINPKGEPFYAIGVDHINYYVHKCAKLGYAPYNRNCQQKYGSIDTWADVTSQRLKDWGFNVLGVNESPELRHRKMPHEIFLAIGSSFAHKSALHEPAFWHYFPNVFDPQFEAACLQRAKELCAPHKADPDLLGYFLDNELQWKGSDPGISDLFQDVMKCSPKHSAKIALVEFLKKRHTTIDQFNQVWKQNISSWNDLFKLTRLPVVSESAETIHRDFLQLIGDRYFAVTVKAVRAADPNHLILGCRFAGKAPDWALKAAGRYCDVVSFNDYPYIDFESRDLSSLAARYEAIYRMVGRPLYLTEWSFPALDSNLPCSTGGGMRVDTQTQRAQCFEAMQRMLFSLPFFVGSNYFMWADQPRWGRDNAFSENCNYGLVNEQDEPYKGLTEKCEALNPLVHAIHAGTYPEVWVKDIVRTQTGVEVLLENMSTRSQEVPVQVTIGNNSLKKTVVVPSAVADNALRNVGLDMIKNGEIQVNFSVSLEPGFYDVQVKLEEQSIDRNGVLGPRTLQKGILVPAGAGKSFDPGRALVMVANPTETRFQSLPILLDYPIAGKGSTKTSLSLVTTSSSQQVSFPVQVFDKNKLLIDLKNISANSSLTGKLQEGQSSISMKSSSQAIRITRKNTRGFIIDNGVLRLEHDGKSGNIFDRILVSNVMLGSYNPLLWQYPGKSEWIKTDTLVNVIFHQGMVATELDVITELSKEGVGSTKVIPFRVAHRVTIFPGCPYFFTRLLWIKNIGTSNMTLKGYYFYLMPSIGGTSAGDDLGPGTIPYYYREECRATWYDSKVGGRIGCIPLSEEIKSRFWRDPSGGFHPDVCYEFSPEMILETGKKYMADNAPVLLVFGALDSGQGPANWIELKKHLNVRSRLIVKMYDPQGKELSSQVER